MNTLAAFLWSITGGTLAGTLAYASYALGRKMERNTRRPPAIPDYLPVSPHGYASWIASARYTETP